MTNILQSQWFDEVVEKKYITNIKNLIEQGALDKAQDILLADLATLETSLSGQCPYIAKRLEVDGWHEMIEAITEFEGEPITAIHLMLSNEDDLSFEDRETVFEPMVEVAVYTDEIYPFSQGDVETLRAESLLPDRPWYGQSEDVEIFLELLGLGEFNTALLRHKRQYFFRDQMHELDKLQGMAEDIVPLSYIEFMLCSMFRTVLFHQAIRSIVESEGLPNNIAVLAGTYNMKFDASSVYLPTKSERVESKEMADLVVSIKRETIIEPKPDEVKTFRQKTLIEEEVVVEEEKQGFFKRLFRRAKKAA